MSSCSILAINFLYKADSWPSLYVNQDSSTDRQEIIVGRIRYISNPSLSNWSLVKCWSRGYKAVLAVGSLVLDHTRCGGGDGGSTQQKMGFCYQIYAPLFLEDWRGTLASYEQSKYCLQHLQPRQYLDIWLQIYIGISGHGLWTVDTLIF